MQVIRIYFRKLKNKEIKKISEAYLKSHHPEISKIGILMYILLDLFLCKATHIYITYVFLPK